MTRSDVTTPLACACSSKGTGVFPPAAARLSGEPSRLGDRVLSRHGRCARARSNMTYSSRTLRSILTGLTLSAALALLSACSASPLPGDASTVDLRSLEARAARLSDANGIKRLQRAYGYYWDKGRVGRRRGPVRGRRHGRLRQRAHPRRSAENPRIPACARARSDRPGLRPS